ncbi:MAG: peptidoglycan editing factor PgeF [Candidatus Puniceispirillaceae bacterium]
MTIPVFGHELFDDLPVRYGFFGKAGGVSQGVYDSLNCGYGSQDDQTAIQQNRDRAAGQLGIQPDNLAGLYQSHSADIITITHPHQLTEERPKADGLVTHLPDIGLAILTADCTPILCCDPDMKIIGACHAGWRGAASGIMSNLVSAMTAIGAKAANIRCLIGPTIAKPSYQVGSDMRSTVIAQSRHADAFFSKDDRAADKYVFDLPHFVMAEAKAAGISHIAMTDHDTYRESDLFFSHRRATHAGLPDTGRQIAIIAQSSK